MGARKNEAREGDTRGESCFSPRVSPSRPLLGSFSIDDGNGSENVSFKMNSRFFNLCRVYSNLLK